MDATFLTLIELTTNIYTYILQKGRTALQVAEERGYIEIVELLQPQAEEDHGDLDSPQAHGSGLFVEEPEPVGKEEEDQSSDTPTTLTKEEGKDGRVLKGIRKFLPSWPWQKDKLVRLYFLSLSLSPSPSL